MILTQRAKFKALRAFIVRIPPQEAIQQDQRSWNRLAVDKVDMIQDQRSWNQSIVDKVDMIQDQRSWIRATVDKVDMLQDQRSWIRSTVDKVDKSAFDRRFHYRSLTGNPAQRAGNDKFRP